MSNLRQIEVELIEIVNDIHTVRQTVLSDINGDFTFAPESATGNAWYRRFKRGNNKLPYRGELLKEDLTQVVYSGSVVDDMNLSYDNTLPLTGEITIKSGGSGTQANPQVGDLYMPSHLKITNSKGLGIKTKTYQWVDSSDSDAVICNHRGLPVNTSMVGMTPKLLVNATDSADNPMVEIVEQLGEVTNPSNVSAHIFDYANEEDNLLYYFRYLDVIGDYMKQGVSTNIDYFQVVDVTGQYYAKSYRQTGHMDFVNGEAVCGTSHGLYFDQKIGPTGGVKGWHLTFAGTETSTLNSGTNEGAGFYHAFGDGSAQSSTWNRVRILHWTDARDYLGMFRLGSGGVTDYNSVDNSVPKPLGSKLLAQAYILPDPGNNAVTGQGGKIVNRVNSEANTDPILINGSVIPFTDWSNQFFNLNLHDYIGEAASIATLEHASIQLRGFNAEFFMFSNPASASLFLQSKADELYTHSKNDTLTY